MFRVELDRQFPAEWHVDIRDVVEDDLPGPFDFAWASPPCTSYSVGSFRHHWHAETNCLTCRATMHRSSYEQWWHAEPTCTRVRPGPLRYEPKSPTGVLGHELLEHTLWLIRELAPRWWVVENPRALMRKMPALAGVDRRTITHCQYGDPRRMKPTDLFGIFPASFEARACRNGDPCHEAAPRGARTGTQGLSSTDAAMLPPMLGQELLAAMEDELQAEEQAA